MGTEIHAMKGTAGWLYRLWQNTSDVYCCPPMGEEAFLKWEREHWLHEAALNHDSRTPYDLRSAREEPYNEGWALEVDHDHDTEPLPLRADGKKGLPDSGVVVIPLNEEEGNG